MPDIRIVIVTRDNVEVFVQRLNILLQGLEAIVDREARKDWREAFRGTSKIWLKRRKMLQIIESRSVYSIKRWTNSLPY
ncbi:hypothetical protein BWI93_26460 [Siphonobacter sp. BAB-5385]|nr:hypothetical protein BWI93_26460 [Siphonobacter sp. BAB-5385]